MGVGVGLGGDEGEGFFLGGLGRQLGWLEVG